MTEPDDRPWLRFYGSVPHTLEYPRITLYQALVEEHVGRESGRQAA